MSRDQFFGITEQGKAGKQRMDDALALFRDRRYRGSVYLAGYSVECLLKTKLMRMYDCRQLRELEEELRKRRALGTSESVFTHQLGLLFRLTRSTDRLRRDAGMWRAFVIADLWVPAWRYNARPCPQEYAEDYLEAVRTITTWIENNI